MICLLDSIVIEIRGSVKEQITEIQMKNTKSDLCSKKFLVLQNTEEPTLGIGCILTLTRIINDYILKNAEAVPDDIGEFNIIPWYVAQYPPSIPQQGILLKHILSKLPTQLRYSERSVFIKEVNDQNLSTFELESQKGINVSIFNICVFQQGYKQNSKNLNNDVFR